MFHLVLFWFGVSDVSGFVFGGYGVDLGGHAAGCRDRAQSSSLRHEARAAPRRRSCDTDGDTDGDTDDIPVRQLRNEIKDELEYQLSKVQDFVDTEVSKQLSKEPVSSLLLGGFACSHWCKAQNHINHVSI